MQMLSSDVEQNRKYLHEAPLPQGHVCLVEVEPSPEQVYSKTEKGQEFFCRVSNTTRSLTLAQVQSYIQSHWT
jgi:hypothetical protein